MIDFLLYLCSALALSIKW